MDVSQMQEVLKDTLNSSIFSTDSVYGILIIVIIAYLVYRSIRKVTSCAGSIIGFILLLEIGHICAFNTEIGTSFPVLQTIFKYDVLTALAQLCVGTKVSDFLLYFQAWLIVVMQTVAGFVNKVLTIAVSYFQAAIS